MSTSTRRRSKLLLAGPFSLSILAVAVILLLGLHGRRGAPATSSSRQVALPGVFTRGNGAARGAEADGRAAPTSDAEADRSGRYAAGEVLRYQLRSVRTVTSSVAPTPGSAADAAASIAASCTLAGSLRVRVYRETEAGWTVGIELADLRAEVAASPAASQNGAHDAFQNASQAGQSLVAALSTEAMACIERSGKIDRLRFLPSVSDEARDQFRTLIARLQVIFPEDPAAKHWTAEEDDLTGRALVEYRRGGAGRAASPSDGEAILKRKLRYLETFQSGGPDLASAMKVAGSSEISLDAGRGTPVRVAGQELLKIDTPALFGPVEAVDEFEIALETRTVEAGSAASFETLLAAVDSEESTLGPHWRGRGAQSGLIDAVDLTEELALAERIFNPATRSSGEAVQCFQRLVQALHANPDNAKAVLDFIRARPENVTLAAELLGALGSAGTDAAQAALEDAITGEDLPAPLRESALLALSQVESPIQSLDPLLESLHEEGGDLAVNALLVLGAMGDRLRSASPERFESIEDYVAGAALNGSDPALLPAALEAVGNLGPRETPAVVLNAYRAGDEIVRMSAVRAVRKIADRSADEILRAALFSDPSEDVRLAAATVMAGREGGAEALRRAALGDAADSVRRRAVRELGPSIAREPESARTVEAVARADASEDVRSEAMRLLGR